MVFSRRLLPRMICMVRNVSEEVEGGAMFCATKINPQAGNNANAKINLNR